MSLDKDLEKVIKSINLTYKEIFPAIQTLTDFLNSSTYNYAIKAIQDATDTFTEAFPHVKNAIDTYTEAFPHIKNAIDTYTQTIPYLKNANKFQKLTKMLNSEVLNFPYPYTTESLVLIADGEKGEDDLRKDILLKLTSGKIVEEIEEHFFPFFVSKDAEKTKLIIREVFALLANEENEMYLEVIWLFPISERIFRNFFEEFFSKVELMLKIILERIEGKINETEDREKKIKDLRECLDNFEKIREIGVEKIDLGTMLHAIELSLDQWDSYEVERMFAISIISRFVNLRNDIIHGRFIKIQPKHVAIIISMFIMIVNIILMKEEKNPILFEL